MQLIDVQIIDAVTRTLGTCPGCGDGGYWGGSHCPCEGCDCPAALTTKEN